MRVFATALDRHVPPAPQALRLFAFPTFERHRLANGTAVFLLAEHRTPMLFLGLVLPAGASQEPAEQAGLATLTAALLTEGTTERSAPEVASAVERLGATYGSGAAWDEATLWMKLPARHLSTGLGLLAEIATRPAFRSADFERVRRQRLTELLRRKDQPGTQADLALIRAVYGHHPYGRSVLGDAETVGALDPGTVESWFRRVHSPAGSALIVTGDFDPADTLGLAERIFGSAPEPGPEASRLEVPPVPAPVRQVWIVDRPGAPQTELRVGQAGVARSHPDLEALKVLSCLLGGKFTSRLNLNLRERNGFTYGVSSSLAPRRGPGPFTLGAAVATPNAGAALAEIFHELDRLRDEPPTASEVADTVQYLLGTFPFTLQTLPGLGSRLEEIATFGLPDDAFDREREQVAAVTATRVHELAREFLQVETMSVVAVGPAAVLAPELARYGAVEVLTQAPSP